MTALVTVAALAVFLGSAALLCCPLLRSLKVSEVPAALLAVSAGRLSRRRLAFILRSRRQVYLEDAAGPAPEYLLVVLAWNSAVARAAAPGRPPPREKAPAVARHHAPAPGTLITAGSVTASQIAAGAREVHPGSASVRGTGSRQAEVAVSRSVMSFAEVPARAGDWRDDLPVARNPWAGQVNAELAEHREASKQVRKEMTEFVRRGMMSADEARAHMSELRDAVRVERNWGDIR